MNTTVLLAPGLGNAGPLHWQSIWEKENPGFRRIMQKDWDNPVCSDWIAEIEKEVSAGETIIIAAHSLACIALAHWAQRTQLSIKAALLVAPPDVERVDFPKEATGFSPVPLKRLPFRSIVVSSENDEYITIERSKLIAGAWGSRFVNAGLKGHINSASNLGSWTEGWNLLNELFS